MIHPPVVNFVTSWMTDTERMQQEWEAWDIGVPLEVVPSPYRSILKPLVEFVENLRMVTPGELVTIVVPEIVPKHWWEHLLHNKTALYIRTAFLFKPNVVVTAIPYLVGHAYRLREWMEHDEYLDDEIDGELEVPPAAEDSSSAA